MSTIWPQSSPSSEPSPAALRVRAEGVWQDGQEWTPRRLKLSYGSVPQTLRGILYRNGPGQFSVGSDRLHPFDGDGLLRRFDFQDGALHFTSRFVATRERNAETKAGRLLHRGVGTPAPGGPLANAMRMRFRNAANTGVAVVGEDLLALWEGGWPHRIDPASLETLSRSDLSGVLRNRFTALERWAVPELPLAAHTRVDPATGRTYGFGVARGVKTRLCIYELDGKAKRIHTVPLAGLPFIHDFCITESAFLFLVPAVHFDLPAAVFGARSPLQAIQHKTDEPMSLLVVPRDGSTMQSYPTVPGFAFHLVQAFERDGTMVVDAFVAQTMMDIEDHSTMFGSRSSDVVAYPTRIEVRLTDGAVQSRRLSDHHGELPRCRDGLRESNILYYAAARRSRTSPFLSGIARLDVSDGETVFSEMYPWIVGEPVVISRGPREEDTWLVVVRTLPEEDRAQVVLLDGPSLRVQACWALPGSLPPDFHGTWVPK